MAYTHSTFKTRVAVWSPRFALFAIVLVVTALALHRFTGYRTDLLLHTLWFGFALAAVGLVLGALAIAIIWRTGRSGSVPATIGIALSLMLLAWPAALISTYRELPILNDVTTDPGNPPEFFVVGDLRGIGANDIKYPGASAAAAQDRFYPLIKPIYLDRSAEEAYELTRTSMRRLGWEIIAQFPPKSRTETPGQIEAVDRTTIIGFEDDIAVRIYGNRSRTRIDVRSASRWGRHDFGRNAARIAAFTRMFKARAQATVALALERAAARSQKSAKSKQRGRSSRKGRRRR